VPRQSSATFRMSSLNQRRPTTACPPPSLLDNPSPMSRLSEAPLVVLSWNTKPPGTDQRYYFYNLIRQIHSPRPQALTLSSTSQPRLVQFFSGSPAHSGTFDQRQSNIFILCIVVLDPRPFDDEDCMSSGSLKQVYPPCPYADLRFSSPRRWATSITT
jgi:hypothetical protein